MIDINQTKETMMAFKEVASLDAEVTIAIGKKDKKTGKAYPKQAEGYYIGRRIVEGRKGDSTIHFLVTNKGNLGVWGTTDLNRKLGSVEFGTMVRITSTGTKPTPNGDMYTYKVEVDHDNTMEVPEALNASAAASNDSDDNESYSGYTDQDSSEEADSEENEEAELTAIAAAEARKAKVQSLLNGAKAKKGA